MSACGITVRALVVHTQKFVKCMTATVIEYGVDLMSFHVLFLRKQ